MSENHTQILRLRHVIERIGLSRSTIYALVAKDAFPAPFTLGERSVGWLAQDVEAWIESRASNKPSRDINN